MQILFIILVIILFIIYYFYNCRDPDDYKIDLLNLFYEIKNKLEDNNIIYWITGGTLLGARRHQNIIPWDDDIDIGVRVEDIDKIKKIISNDLVLQKTKHCYKIFSNKGKKVKNGDWKVPFIDIFTYKIYNNRYIDTEPQNLLKWPFDYFEVDDINNLKKYTFNKQIVYGPDNPDTYLTRNYGIGWQVYGNRSYDHYKMSYPEYKTLIVVDEVKKTLPYLWVYWENMGKEKRPAYIDLCLNTIRKHCRDFMIIELDEYLIYKYLPELRKKEIKYNLKNLLIQQKVDYYRVLLLQKYGGLYIDADTIVMKDPMEIINKLNTYDYVGFGCTGNKCTYGYSRPSNAIMASKPKGKLITNILKNIEKKLEKETKFDYFDLGKYIIWEEIDKLEKENYKYYHYENHYDGTRDVNGQWITSDYIFSNREINYKYPDKQIFVIFYNSQIDTYKSKTQEELMNEETNFSKFIKKSLNN